MAIRIKSLKPSVQIGIVNLRTLSEIGSGSASIDELIDDAVYSINYLLEHSSIDKPLKIYHHEKKIQKIPISGEKSTV